MKRLILLFQKQVLKITLALGFIFLVSTSSFAQNGGYHWKGDTALFKRHFRHPNDTILARRINDSLFLHCHFDSIFGHRFQQWNDTLSFHRRWDTAFATRLHQLIDSLDSTRRARLDSLLHRLHRRFDTICARHDWNDTTHAWKGNDSIFDTICEHHWSDTIITRHHWRYVILLHKVSFWNTKIVRGRSATDDATISVGSAGNATDILPASVAVYPNPIGNNAVIRISNSPGTLMFRLFDCTGKLVMRMENLSNGDVELNRNNLPAGLYFYQALNNNATVSTGKLVMQ